MRVNSLFQSMGMWKFYFVGFVFLAYIVYVGYQLATNQFKTTDLIDIGMGFGLLFPLIMVGMLYNQFSIMWRTKNYVWWLTLPYSRVTLITTRMLASLWKMLNIVLIFYSIVFVLTLGIVLIQGSSLDVIHQFLRFIIVSVIVIFFFYPALAAYMMLLANIGQSRYKPLLPLLWVLFFPAMIIAIQGYLAPIFSTGMRISGELVVNDSWYVHFQISYFWYTVVISWAISLLIVFVNAHLLKRKLEL